MTGKPGRKGSIEYAAGKRALGNHHTAHAVDLLRISVECCPASERRELRGRLYWLALALKRIGKEDMAVKALASAQKLGPRSNARRLYEHWVNGYGMPRSACEEHDDYRAFFSIHVRRYYRGTGKSRFSDALEMETILRLIAESWVRIGKMRDLNGLGCTEKLALFNDTRIDFPRIGGFPGLPGGPSSIIRTDFRKGTVIGMEDRCSCGSGLPFRRCCGRIKTPEEY